MKIQDIPNEIVREVLTEEQIENKLDEIAKQIDKNYYLLEFSVEL